MAIYQISHSPVVTWDVGPFEGAEDEPMAMRAQFRFGNGPLASAQINQEVVARIGDGQYQFNLGQQCVDNPSLEWESRVFVLQQTVWMGNGQLTFSYVPAEVKKVPWNSCPALLLDDNWHFESSG